MKANNRLQEYIRVKNNCDGNNCSRCGECCGMGIPISRKEEKKIREYIKEHNIQPEIVLDENNLYDRCCFYDTKNKLCKIYEVRPNICRTFKCNKKHETLLKERNANQQTAYWNQITKKGVMKNFIDFNLLFYDNPKPLLAFMIHMFASKNNGVMTKELVYQMKEALVSMNLKELADSINIEQ